MGVVADIDSASGMATAENIVARGGRADFLPLDVTSESQWSTAVETIRARAGRIDVLVNKAGIFLTKPVCEASPKERDKIFDVNVRGTFLGVRAIIPAMREAGKRTIINVSSIYGLVGAPSAAAYIASKGAVRLFSKFCAIDLAPLNIRGNSIHPCVVETNMTKALISDPALRAAPLRTTLLQRPAQPDEVSQAVLFLASGEDSFITGAELVVNGGRIRHCSCLRQTVGLYSSHEGLLRQGIRQRGRLRVAAECLPVVCPRGFALFQSCAHPVSLIYPIVSDQLA